MTMIDFNEELKKFTPCLNMEQVEEVITGNEIKDFTDALCEMMEKMDTENEKKDK